MKDKLKILIGAQIGIIAFALFWWLQQPPRNPSPLFVELSRRLDNAEAWQKAKWPGSYTDGVVKVEGLHYSMLDLTWEVRGKEVNPVLSYWERRYLESKARRVFAARQRDRDARDEAAKRQAANEVADWLCGVPSKNR